MKFAHLPLIVLFFLVGCAQEAPKCSDEKTLDLVKQILSNELSESDNSTDLAKKEIADHLKFEFPRATAYDKEIKKYSCDLKLVAGGSYQVPLKYESQLNDQDQHLVSVGGILAGDVFQLKLALLNVMQKDNANTGVTQASYKQANQSEVFISSAGISNTPLEKLLSGVYDQYLPSQKCWIATDENQQNYCMKIDSFDKVNVKGVNRFYAILSGVAVDEKGEENGSHATQGLLGAFVLEENAKQLNLIASESKIAMGDFGNGPTKWKLVKIGPDDYYGWKNETGTMHQGYSNNFFHILAPYGAKVIDIADFISGVSDEGACSAEPCTTLESSFEFDTSKTTEKVFPLLVRVKGKDKGVALKDKNYNFYFDDKKWKYVEPNDYILKDKGF